MVPWLAQVLEWGSAGDQPVFCDTNHNHMTVMWIFRRPMWCLIRRNCECKGTWGKDGSKGGIWVWKPHFGAPLSSLPEEGINVGSLLGLNLL